MPSTMRPGDGSVVSKTPVELMPGNALNLLGQFPSGNSGARMPRTGAGAGNRFNQLGECG
jgi:hypothetical protein